MNLTIKTNLLEPASASFSSHLYKPNPHTPDGALADPDFVNYRLNEAGTTLLALPNGGYTTRLRTQRLDILEPCIEAAGFEQVRLRPQNPTAAQVSRMDQALAWIVLIPADRLVLRRLVGARALVSPLTGRHLYSWRRLAKVVGADHKAVQRWHAQAINLICDRLNSHEATPPVRRRMG